MKRCNQRQRRGAAAVEFALTLPFLLAVLMGIVEMSLLQSRMYVINRAARDGCRVGAGVLEGGSPDGTQIRAAANVAAQQVLDDAGVTCGSVGCDIQSTWFLQDGWMMLRVEVGVPYQPFTNLLPMIPIMTRGQFVTLTQQQVHT